jgi:hypothetical protein
MNADGVTCCPPLFRMSSLMRFCLVLLCLLGPLIALLALLPLAICAQQRAVRNSAQAERVGEASRTANSKVEISDSRTAGSEGVGRVGGGD